MTPKEESDDEAPDKADRGSSPVLQRSHSSARVTTSNPIRTASPVRTESAPPPTAVPITVEPAPSVIPSQNTFTFRSSHPYPQDADIILSDLDLSDNARAPSHDGSVTSHTSNTATSGVGVTRPSRTRHSARVGARPTNTIGRGAGQKRKINFGEFFDIGNLGQGRDGFGGGGKRGRFA